MICVFYTVNLNVDIIQYVAWSSDFDNSFITDFNSSDILNSQWSFVFAYIEHTGGCFVFIFLISEVSSNVVSSRRQVNSVSKCGFTVADSSCVIGSVNFKFYNSFSISRNIYNNINRIFNFNVMSSNVHHII